MTLETITSQYNQAVEQMNKQSDRYLKAIATGSRKEVKIAQRAMHAWTDRVIELTPALQAAQSEGR